MPKRIRRGRIKQQRDTLIGLIADEDGQPKKEEGKQNEEQLRNTLIGLTGKLLPEEGGQQKMFAISEKLSIRLLLKSMHFHLFPLLEGNLRLLFQNNYPWKN